MANNRQGPRQPLSQRRPKAVAVKKAAKSVSKVASKLVLKLAPKATPKTNVRPTAKGGKKLSSRLTTLSANPPLLYDRLLALYPDAHCELDFRTPFELLVATILSAQCTDKRVNMVTPALFARYPDVRSLAAARQEDVEELIKSTGFFRNKAKSLIGMATAVVEHHGGEIPADMAALVVLPGVGRKTANVILGNAFGRNDGIVVDTHVTRLSNRLALANGTDAVKIERTLLPLFPQERWTMLSHLLIEHGRQVCDAKRPRCGECLLADMCPSVMSW